MLRFPSLENPTQEPRSQSEIQGQYTPFTRFDPETGRTFEFWWRPTYPTERVVAYWFLPQEAPAGFYRVEMFIPGEHATTRQASIEVVSAGGQVNPLTLDMMQYSDVWVSLGDYNLDENSSVSLSDQSDETPPKQTIKGPVRFVPVDSSQARFDAPVGSQSERDGSIGQNGSSSIIFGNWMISNPFLTSNALGYEPGMDLSLALDPNADLGEPVYAIGDGEVVFAGFVPDSWGGLVVIAHPNALVRLPDGNQRIQTVFSRYSALSEKEIMVEPGESVSRGQQIGTIGLTPGTTSGSHLHFDIIYSDIANSLPRYWPESKDDVIANFVDPLQFLIDNHNPFVGE
jgi:murein DD-endopeptidase MepM/ murein hydrolase activator NlpD